MGVRMRRRNGIRDLMYLFMGEENKLKKPRANNRSSGKVFLAKPR
jgi:hypothetical protein